MLESAPRAKIFYGWWIVGTCLTSLLLAGGLGFYSFGVYFTPLIDKFGWSRAQLSLAMSIGSLVVGLSGLMVGKWVDRYGARRVMASGALITGGAWLLLGFTPNIWYFYAVYFVAAIGMVGLLHIPVATVVSNWFEERRGLAMGVTITGFGLGGLLMIPLSTYLISVLGWQGAYRASGLLIWVVLIPLSLFVIRHRPHEIGLLPDGRMSEPEDERANSSPATVAKNNQLQASPTWTLAGAMRTPAFWLLAGSLTLVFLGMASVLTHAIPFFEEQEIFSRQAAAAILSSVTGVSILGRVAAGYMADRMPLKWLAIFFFLLLTVGMLLLLAIGSMIIVFGFVIVFGLALGGLAALEPLLAVEYFGLESFGAIFGTLLAIITLGFAGGPLLTGYIFDVTESYDPAFLGFIATTLLATAIILFLRPPHPSHES